MDVFKHFVDALLRNQCEEAGAHEEAGAREEAAQAPSLRLTP